MRAISRPSRAPLRLWSLLLTAGLGLLPWAAAAQDNEPPASRAEFTIGQQLAVENGDVIGITPLDLTYITGTRSQQLQFSLSAPLRENDPDTDKTVSMGDVNARLLYRRFVRNASIEAELSYRDIDLDDEIYYDDLNDTLVTLDPGSVTYSTARLGYVFGSQSKLGGEIGLRYEQRDYQDTIDPDLVDSRTTSADLRLYLEPISTLRGRLIASGSRTDSDGGTDSRSTQFGAGASIQLDKVTNLDVQLTYDRIRREEDLTGIVEEAKGPGMQLGLTRSRPDGDWSLSFSTAPGTEGRRDTLMLGRVLEFPRHTLSARLGMTRFAGSLDPVFEVGYERPLDDLSKFSAQLSRRGVTDEDGDEAINTSLSASYNRQLSDVSSLGGSIRYRQTDVQSGTGEDARSIALDVNYNRRLYNDFSLVAGASIIRSSNDDDDDEDDDDRVYLGISRSFTWLP